MPGNDPRFPTHLTPLERERLSRLISRLAADERVVRIRLFGSRARGRSHPGSDLDIAVDVASPRTREVEGWLAREAMDADELSPPSLQVVGMFAGQPPSRLDHALAREGLLLWTRS
jgi:hypothetical protein